MTYLSVCSGIKAASVAWEPLGFTPVGVGEIYTDNTEYAAMLYITNSARSFLNTHQKTESLADSIWTEYLDSKQMQLRF